MPLKRLLAGTAVAAVALVVLPGASSTAAVDACPDRDATIRGTAGDDRLVGTAGDDVIHGLGGDDTLVGSGGNDVLCGGDGTDVIRGGEGDDELYGGRNGLRTSEDNPPDNVGDTVSPGPGDDVVDVGQDNDTDEGGGFQPDRISFASSAAAVTVDLEAGTAQGEGTDTLVVEGRLTAVGSAHDDVLLGSAYSDGLLGGKGADVLVGREGDDELDADPMSYRLSAPGWDDRAYGGPGNDSLQVGNGDDLVRGGQGNDFSGHGSGRIDLDMGPGRDGVDTHLALADDQRLLGGAGRDEVYLWGIVDEGERVLPRGRMDLVEGRVRMELGSRVHDARMGGFERVRIPDGNWRVLGTATDETFYGSELPGSRLRLWAGAGDDLLSGTPGDDLLDGGPGRDRATDSGGRDRCVSIERYLGGDRCEVNR